MRIRIDGEVKEVDLKNHVTFSMSDRQIQSRMLVWGKDLTGRKCIVASHGIPEKNFFLNHIEKGGAVISAGHRYTKV